MSKRVLLTGGAGFIGSHAVEHWIANTDWEIVVLDGLNYAGRLDRLAQFRDHPRVKFVYHNFKSPLDAVSGQIGKVDFIVHMGAETHVDNSITNPRAFVESNVVGTFNVLEFARSLDALDGYIQISTDEVFGPAPTGVDWQEWDRLKPSNPYSATKAGGDCLAIAYATTYGLPTIVTRTMNVYAPGQHKEKLVPKTIDRFIRGEPMTIHGTPGNIGSRHWLHATNQVNAIMFLMNRFSSLEKGDIFNVVGFVEKTNLEMAEAIAGIMGVEALIEYVDFHTTRPGHDRRYSLSGAKMHKLGWRPPLGFDDSLRSTVEWYLRNPGFLGLTPEDVQNMRGLDVEALAA